MMGPDSIWHNPIPVILWGAVAVWRLALAAACGAAIGWQREAQDKSAGLRTHMLLAIGACLFALVTVRLDGGDPLRLIQGMLMGTGFIAGGVVFRQGDLVRGLTTAVGLWVMGAIGMAAGVGQYFLAVLATAAAFLVLSVLRRVEVKVARHPPEGGGPASGP